MVYPAFLMILLPAWLGMVKLLPPLRKNDFQELKIIFSFSLKTYDCFKLSSIVSSSSTSLIQAESRVLDDLDDLESLLLKNNFATKEVGPKTKKYIRTSTKGVKYFLKST